MDYTETTTTSWFSRLGSSFKGIGFGLILIVIGTGLLWWNEGDFVKTRDALNEARGVAVELPNIGQIDKAFNGKLVHAKGLADTKDILKDPIFGVGGVGIALERKVEFYQWTEQSKSETRQKLGGGEETVTTYSYSQKWVGHTVNSQQFHAPEARFQYANGVNFQVQSQTLRARNVSFGAYKLPDFLISAIGNKQPFNVNLDPKARERITRDILAVRSDLLTQGSAAGFGSNLPISRSDLNSIPANYLPKVIYEQGNTLYLGVSPTMPQVGDVRISFFMTGSAQVSLIAKVQGQSFEAFHSANGKDVSALSMGDVSMEQMFSAKHEDNAMMTWVFRLLGLGLVIGGFGCVLAPLKVIASVIPLLGNIVGIGTGLASFLLGSAWSLIIMAIAWLRFRPAAGGLMVAIALALVIFSYLRGRNQSTN